MKKYILFFICWACVLITSCTTKGTNWDIDGYAPVAETTLDITKLVGDENIQVNNDSSLWLNIDTKAYTFNLDSVTDIPPITQSYSYVWPLPAFALPAGTVLPTFDIPVIMDVNDLELRELWLKEGKLRLKLKSTASERLVFTYYIPAATKNSVSFSFTDTVRGLANGEDTVFYTKEFDVNDYHLNLTGPGGVDLNTFTAKVDVRSIAGDPPINVSLNQQVFTIVNEMADIVPAYGKGYLGQYNFAQNNITADLEFMRSFISGMVDIEQLSLKLVLNNTIGAEVRFKPDYLKGINSRNNTSIVLTHPSMGTTINVNRAYETGNPMNPVNPTQYTYAFNAGNSNIESLVELLPDKFEFSADMNLNPYGNIGGYTDFYYYDQPAFIQLQVQAPIKFSISQLYFLDTLSNPFASLDIVDPVQDGEILIRVENKFPLEMKLQLYTMDNQGNITDSILVNDLVNAAPVNMLNRVENPVTTDLVASVSPGKILHLRSADKIMLKALLNTQPQAAGRLQMYSDYYLKVKLIADIKYNIEL